MCDVYYAIGDIHGELSKLRNLHERISAHHAEHFAALSHTRIHLGDYVDRGPNSCGVIDYIKELSLNDDFQVINLKGNHEVLMTEAQTSIRATALNHWLVNGGEEALRSYDNVPDKSSVEAHIKWIKTLPSIYIDECKNLVFVHAGIDPETFPDCTEDIHMWTRNAAFFQSEHWTNPALANTIVIHGHTPTLTDYPDISRDGRRINIDTGACYGGPLSAVVLAPNTKPYFIFHDQ